MISKREIEMRSNTNLAPTMSKLTRKDYNLMILDQLEELVEMCPEQRFGQIISNYVFPGKLGVVPEADPFYEESEETYYNVRQVGRQLRESLNSESYERV